MHDTRSGINLAVAIPWILTLVTALVGIWQFTVQQGQANRQPFLQKQLDLAFLASETTIKLATLMTRPIGRKRVSISGYRTGDHSAWWKIQKWNLPRSHLGISRSSGTPDK